MTTLIKPIGCNLFRLIVCYCIATGASYLFAVLNWFYFWPAHLDFFLTWPIIYGKFFLVPQDNETFASSSFLFLVAIFCVEVLPIVWGIWRGNKWYTNASVVAGFLLMILSAMAVEGLKV
jgi:hypothetical protein